MSEFPSRCPLLIERHRHAYRGHDFVFTSAQYAEIRPSPASSVFTAVEHVALQGGADVFPCLGAGA